MFANLTPAGPVRLALLAWLLIVAAAPAVAWQLEAPASFSGMLPCADCPGIAWHLDLWPDGRFHLRRAYRERSLRDDDIGRWRVNPADESLLLFGGRESPLRLQTLDSNTLRLLDRRGREIESQLPYELRRSHTFAPAELSLEVVGEFTYLADAASLRECRTGAVYAVLMEGDYAAVEERYLAQGPAELRKPLALRLEVSLVNRQVHEGEGMPQSLRIERLVSDAPGLRCAHATAQATLPNTYWRVLRLDEEAVESPAGTRELHFVLQDSDETIAGFSGCNQFRGSYRVAGGTLTFGPLASTMMACPEAQMSIERRLRRSLEAAARWRISGQTLELLDADGGSRAVLEAVYQP